MFVGDAEILHFKDICFILSFVVTVACLLLILGQLETTFQVRFLSEGFSKDK